MAKGILIHNNKRYAVDDLKSYENRFEASIMITGIINPIALMDPACTIHNPNIEQVIFNNPATIVIWGDGTKTVVKCQGNDTYSEELGLAMCIAKKYLGNKGNYNEVFKKWLPKDPINDITVESMRRALTEYCHNHYCNDCPLHSPVCRCGCGTYFLETKWDGSYVMTDDEIRNAYKVAFGK